MKNRQQTNRLFAIKSHILTVSHEKNYTHTRFMNYMYVQIFYICLMLLSIQSSSIGRHIWHLRQSVGEINELTIQRTKHFVCVLLQLLFVRRQMSLLSELCFSLQPLCIIKQQHVYSYTCMYICTYYYIVCSWRTIS